MDFITQLLAYLNVIHVVLTIIAAIVISPVIKWIIKKIKKMKDLFEVSERLKKLDEIHAQLMPNGGSSIKDSIDRIERKLVFNTEWIRMFDKDSGRIVFHLDANGNLEWANKAFLDLFDCELSDVLGLGWLSKVAREDYSLISTEIDNAIEDQRDINVAFNLNNGQHVDCIARAMRSKATLFGYLCVLTIKHAKS